MCYFAGTVRWRDGVGGRPLHPNRQLAHCSTEGKLRFPSGGYPPTYAGYPGGRNTDFASGLVIYSVNQVNLFLHSSHRIGNVVDRQLVYSMF